MVLVLVTRLRICARSEICLAVEMMQTDGIKFGARITNGGEPDFLWLDDTTSSRCECRALTPGQLSTPVDLGGPQHPVAALVTRAVLGIVASTTCLALAEGVPVTTNDQLSALLCGAGVQEVVDEFFVPMMVGIGRDVESEGSGVVGAAEEAGRLHDAEMDEVELFFHHTSIFDPHTPATGDLPQSMSAAGKASTGQYETNMAKLTKFTRAIEAAPESIRADAMLLLEGACNDVLPDPKRRLAALEAMHACLVATKKASCRYSLIDEVNCTKRRMTMAVGDLVFDGDMPCCEVARHLFLVFLRRNKRKRD